MLLTSQQGTQQKVESNHYKSCNSLSYFIAMVFITTQQLQIMQLLRNQIKKKRRKRKRKHHR